MEEIKRKRGSVKAKVTTFKKYLTNLSDKTANGIQLDEFDFLQITERLSQTDKWISQFEEHQNQIESQVDTAELEVEYAERDSFYDNFYNQIAKAKFFLKQHSNNLNDNRGQSSSNSSGSCQGLGITLKPIELPKFNGSYNNWLEFADLFESLVNTNENLDDIRRFHYLRSSLEGGAAQVIRSLEFTANNYPVAWKLIRERYDNKRILISNHVNELFNIESINKESSQKLRQIIDIFSKHLYALKQLGLPTEHWDVLLIHIISNKLDSSTQRAWENSRQTNDIPTFEEFKAFLKSKADLLETIEITQVDKRQQVAPGRGHSTKYSYTRGLLSAQENSTLKCPICKNNHKIYHCPEFMSLSPKDKFNKSRAANICTNCLKPGHFYKQCTQNSCKKCSSKHHTLLHPERVNNDQQRKNEHNHSVQESDETTASMALSSFNENVHMTSNETLLSTVIVNILDKDNKVHTARALIDCGSQSSFITEEFSEKLQLLKTNTNLSVTGINNTSSLLKFKCNLTLKSPINDFCAPLSCLIVPKITGNLPTMDLDIRKLNIPRHLKLADKLFHKSQKVDLLIGNDMFWRILCQGKFSLGKNKPYMQKTVFGWILAGPHSSQDLAKNNSTSHCHFSTSVDLQDQLSRFWNIEEVQGEKPLLSKEEIACEQYFSDNTQRDSNGRFIVSLPFSTSLQILGDSFQQAKNRFFKLEQRLNKDHKLKALYNDFMKEYIQLGHMKRIGNADHFLEGLGEGPKNNEISYYMPHHGILRENSITTRLRVVFDCSAQTTTGISLNDIQMTGPTLQNELISILLRFRIHSYVVSADIEKMYRQVLVCENQRSLQRILWRQEIDDPLEIYELQTVTYGMKCASYLAIKCLITLGLECDKNKPAIANIIKSDFYVDDLLTGFESIDEARYICKELTEILKSGGFPLRKFYSNEPEILNEVKTSSQTTSVIHFGQNEHAKTLGLSWSPHSDLLLYKITPVSFKVNVTKRRVLSDIAQIFDPLGLLSACTIIAKILLQKLWLERISWDDPLPVHLQTSYIRFRSQLLYLNDIKIKRHVRCSNPLKVELHGFSDASESAYGACIYVKSIDVSQKSFCHLICAKSKVAPLKPTSMPRLELCGALLLARLVNKVINSLNIDFHAVHLWTDSTIVLHWMKLSANTLKTFVSNRVMEIQETTTFAEWHHVPSKDNPADLLSRGVEPQNMANCDVWWYGPSWLLENRDKWPSLAIFSNDLNDISEIKGIKSFTCNVDSKTIFLFERFSNLERLKRCAAYVFRFIKNCQLKTKITSLLSVAEINEAFNQIIKLVQGQSFSSEVRKLSLGKELDKSSKMFNLNPFLDNHGLIRVGGRLKNSQFDYSKKHPIILPSNHNLTKLIFSHFHVKLMHAGPQLLLSNIREIYWPLSGRNLARCVVHQCVICFRQKPKTVNPIMGNLPEQRLQPGPAFITTGVDYAGPFIIRDKKGRGCKSIKGYLCLFICFSTKAIHLELVTELSRDSFLLAFKRFMARRGKPQRIFSDNGTNFVAASSELKLLQNFLQSSASFIQDFLSTENISWAFSPPYSPHFGGLWEAGVKLVKHHLRRVLGNAYLTYEEFNSVLIQVEAIVNSRPILPLSSDPNDLSPLTPAHFLIGRSITTTPDLDLREVPVNRLTRYQLVQQLSRHLWERWNKEYISELQKRTKWVRSTGEVKKNTLVLIKEDNLPPLKWKLGRVLEVIRGTDGCARVFKLKIANGSVITRSFSKLCPLPSNENTNNDN